jgi:hypothetical protein
LSSYLLKYKGKYYFRIWMVHFYAQRHQIDHQKASLFACCSFMLLDSGRCKGIDSPLGEIANFGAAECSGKLEHFVLRCPSVVLIK